jgi:predicted metal-dependent phosphoesterase TrpH
MKNRYIDLHIHSNFSDGKESVESIINTAIKNNTRVISLTEHYNISSYKKARDIAKGRIEIIPGIEIGSSLSSYGVSKKHVCHFTAYFVNRKIYPILDNYEVNRKKNIHKIIRKLNEEGISITSGQVYRETKHESIGRYDIAYTLFKKGYAVSPAHAYSKYLDHGSIAYVEREEMSPTDLIKTIIECGGVPVLVHPKSLKFNYDDMDVFIGMLKQNGICGIEVYNPHNSEEKREELLELCKKYDLIPTVGSDFHSFKDNIEIGLGIDNNLKISDYSIITRLKEKKHEIDIFNKKRAG